MTSALAELLAGSGYLFSDNLIAENTYTGIGMPLAGLLAAALNTAAALEGVGAAFRPLPRAREH